MSFQQGLSGLNAASKSLEAIGNNVANSNTVGFKASQAQFADVFANSLSGAGTGQVGIGVKVATVFQQFTQGNISSSNNPLDLAINGGGFFRMSNQGTITYGRNGQFQLNKDGYIVNSSGAHLTGYSVNSSGVLNTGQPTDLQMDSRDLDPSATTQVQAVLNLDSRNTVPTNTPFDVTDARSYNNATSVSVYDSLGNAHVLQTFYVKTGPGDWDVYASNDGTEVAQLQATPLAITAAAAGGATDVSILTAAWAPTVAAATAAGDAATLAAWTAASTAGSPELTAISDAMAASGATSDTIGAVAAGTVPPRRLGTLMFDSGGHLDEAAMTAAGTTLPLSASLPIYPSTDATDPLVLNIEYEGTTQFGSNFGVNELSQDGYASGRLSGFNVGSDGTIVGRYTNGRSATLGQVALANFRNPNGLQPLGNNVWAATSTSGDELIGSPGSSSLGVLQSSAVEDSNVDLTAELVNMITAQRVYQANAQTIKTQDQVLQTLVNLR
ncbi:flagellar hook protein FlgE [Herbaspirillum sp. ST 5-3]|uniref:flagellar hook protein FlgE n=1 Tax=Oxalobacteraceae TaxID=75682 RepID=UPI0010A3086B|nr:flagellar hook protein FlgE [Herbaspirillum sp. ST 5-3]